MGEHMAESNAAAIRSRLQLEDSWKALVGAEFEQPYMRALSDFLRAEKQTGKRIYPPGPQMFAALDLTPVEFALLEALQTRPGSVLTREQLLDRMYDDYRVVSDRAVDTHIKNLRKKIAAVDPDLEAIESIYGLGYRFNS